MELTFLWGTGDQLPPELRDQLFAGDEDYLTEADLEKMEQDFSSASFEGKLTLLRDLRQAFRRASAGEMDDNLFLSDFFDDEIEAMERLLLRFHRQVLKEIGRRLPLLASRERRALVAVIDPLLAKDVSDLIVPQGDNQPLIELLLQAAEAGCLGTRLSLLALLLSHRDGSKRLGSLAVTAVQEAPTPGLADLHWMMHEHGPLAVRSPAILKTLFARIQGNDDLVRNLAQAVWEEVNVGITFNAFAPKTSPAMRRPSLAGTSAEPMDPAVIKKLAELAREGEELGPLRRYLTLFPEGRISTESLRQWLEDAWTREADGSLFIETVQALIAGASASSSLLDLFRSVGPGGNFATTANTFNFAKVVIDFLRDHADDFRRLPLQTVETVVREIFPHLEGQTDYGSLLIKTYNALCARVSAGEEEFSPLRDALDNRLRQIAEGNRGGRRSSRR